MCGSKASRGDGRDGITTAFRPKNVIPSTKTLNLRLNTLHLLYLMPDLWFSYCKSQLRNYAPGGRGGATTQQLSLTRPTRQQH